jgi:PAS domain S-box-containing protein
MMNAFFKSSDDGVIGLNMEGQVLLWSPGAERLFGWTTEEMLGQSVFCLLPTARHREIHSLYDSARIEQDLPPKETSVLHKQGPPGPWSLDRITAMRDSQGRTIGGVVVARDISRLKSAREAVGRFASSITFAFRQATESFGAAIAGSGSRTPRRIRPATGRHEI